MTWPAFPFRLKPTANSIRASSPWAAFMALAPAADVAPSGIIQERAMRLGGRFRGGARRQFPLTHTDSPQKTTAPALPTLRIRAATAAGLPDWQAAAGPFRRSRPAPCNTG